MDKAINREESRVKQLENIIERENLRFEEFLRENEKKSVEARTLWDTSRLLWLKSDLWFLFYSWTTTENKHVECIHMALKVPLLMGVLSVFVSFEQEAKSKQQKNAEIRKLTAEIVTIKR